MFGLRTQSRIMAHKVKAIQEISVRWFQRRLWPYANGRVHSCGSCCVLCAVMVAGVVMLRYRVWLSPHGENNRNQRWAGRHQAPYGDQVNACRLYRSLHSWAACSVRCSHTEAFFFSLSGAVWSALSAVFPLGPNLYSLSNVFSFHFMCLYMLTQGVLLSVCTCWLKASCWKPYLLT